LEIDSFAAAKKEYNEWIPTVETEVFKPYKAEEY